MPRSTAVVRHYWDSCLFIHLLNATPGRLDAIESLYDELVVTDPSVVAVTSAFTIAEVAFVTSKRNALDPDSLAKIDAFWDPRSPFEIVELYPRVAFEARAIMRESLAFGPSLTAGDAIHFATAKARGVKVFWTYDTKLLALDGRFGFSVQEPTSQTLPFSRGLEPSPAASVTKRPD